MQCIQKPFTLLGLSMRLRIFRRRIMSFLLSISVVTASPTRVALYTFRCAPEVEYHTIETTNAEKYNANRDSART